MIFDGVVAITVSCYYGCLWQISFDSVKDPPQDQVMSHVETLLVLMLTDSKEQMSLMREAMEFCSAILLITLRHLSDFSAIAKFPLIWVGLMHDIPYRKFQWNFIL